jgi:hypothetical protein
MAGHRPCHAESVPGEQRQWGVRLEQVALKTAAAVVFAVVALRGDVPLRLLAGAAAIGLAVLAVRDMVLPVRLAADREGITVVRGFAGREHIPWGDIEEIRLYDSRRLGLRSRLLEIDTGDSLRLLSTHDLGAPADDVERQLRDLRLGSDQDEEGDPGPGQA